MQKLFFLFLLIGCWACGDGNRVQHPLAFYHWKSRLHIDALQKSQLDSLGVKRIYLRFFDVKWNAEIGDNQPVAMLDWDTAQLSPQTEIIPTVFITNASLDKTLGLPLVDTLAHRIGKKIKGMLAAQVDSSRYPVREIQIDCDWSLQTKDKYFRLLKVLRAYFPRLSATIRLHQIKYYTKTGVPPVDRGILMFYNMGKIDDTKEENSILNLKTAQKYFENFELYPLPLDVALPIFYWGVQFRNGKIVQVLHEAEAEELRKLKTCKAIDDRHFSVEESFYYHNTYLYKGDSIRTEKAEWESVQEALHLLEKHLPKQPFEVIFYHLDSAVLHRYPAATLQTLGGG